jgi:hypothetical protein
MIRNITLPASKVAAMIGKNPYCAVNEIFEEMKCKITGEKVKTLNDEQLLNTEELIKLSETLIPDKQIPPEKLNLEHILKVSCYNAIECDTTNKSKEIEQDIKKQISNIFPEKNLSTVSEFITTDINTKRGIKNEDKIINKYNKRHKTTVTDNNSQFYKYPLFEITKDEVTYKFFISAKIDGLHDDILIEVKNRRNRLFNKIPEYELVQMEIYLRILKLDTAKLVQNFNDKTSEHIYNKDDNLWNFIIDNLYQFSHNLLK